MDEIEYPPIELFLDQYSISKLLKACIRKMSPLEISDFICNDKALVNRGIDRDHILN